MCFNFITYWPAMPDIEFCVSDGNATDPYAACGTDALMENKTKSELIQEEYLVPAPYPVFETYFPPLCIPSYITTTEGAHDAENVPALPAIYQQYLANVANFPLLTSSGKPSHGQPMSYGWSLSVAVFYIMIFYVMSKFFN
ncbi:UNVERIFIED_CONTAM: hypothetical protein HDU68_007998 [Siphonaria sp. JEL0065]|nr:hypothetical protein HDU68_007998 [Siphonaria sp. JEL0065]